jgi:Ca2+-binding RTX toxin-like protein
MPGALEIASSDAITGSGISASLQRNGFHLRFTSREYFRGKGARRVDRIFGFNRSNGDKLELSRKVFKGIGKLEFDSVSNGKQLRRAAKTDTDIIYQESSGKLFFNSNGDEKSFGNKGGLFAILESTPFLNADHFILI